MLDAFSIPGKKLALLCERAFRYVRLLQREGRDSAQLERVQEAGPLLPVVIELSFWVNRMEYVLVHATAGLAVFLAEGGTTQFACRRKAKSYYCRQQSDTCFRSTTPIYDLVHR